MYFQYLIVPMSANVHYNKAKLNQLGLQGWLLIAVYKDYFYLMKEFVGA